MQVKDSTNGDTMGKPTVITSPDKSGILANFDAELLARVMSPAQLRALEDLRAANPGATYTPSYVHGISGMLEIEICRPGRACFLIGLTASGKEAGYTIQP